MACYTEAYMFKAIIFDMDGLMVDTEALQSEAFGTTLRHFGVEPVLNAQGIVQTVGVSDNYARLQKQYGLANLDEFIAHKRRIYVEALVRNVTAMPGLHALLQDLTPQSIKKAIASSSAQAHIELIVKKLDIAHHFDAIISGEHIPHSKPAPDIFIEAARRLAVKPADCIVLEDALPGVTAAKAAGMLAVAVPNRFTSHQDFSTADLVVPSLKQLSRKALLELYR
jgi:HAD superfamily hydrolase (TIGR01509 family)